MVQVTSLYGTTAHMTWSTQTPPRKAGKRVNCISSCTAKNFTVNGYLSGEAVKSGSGYSSRFVTNTPSLAPTSQKRVRSPSFQEDSWTKWEGHTTAGTGSHRSNGSSSITG